ncbi:MAG: hypothetical protein MUE55_07370, partial [Thermoplasmata archaeon]|nr:hypothetical protein [Thermoplasmata archaeon]
EYPFYELELFTLDMKKPEMTKIARYKEFDRERTSRRPLDRSVGHDELPSYNDFKNCLLSSGFLDYRNEDHIAKTLADLRDEARDPNKRPRPVFIAIDTNLLYFRFLSRHMPVRHESTDRTVEATDFRYVVSELVQREIDSTITHKYDRDEIMALSSLLAHKELLGEFRNGSAKKARRAKLAFNEMDYLLTELRALRIKGTPARDKELNDIQIAQSYKDWSRSGDYDVMLITGDEDMINHGRTSELMTLQLELPFEPPEHARVDPWTVGDIIHDLAVTLGVVSLSNAGVLVYGEWGGKTSTDYAKENLKIVSDDAEVMASVSRQLDVCRKILGRTG